MKYNYNPLGPYLVPLCSGSSSGGSSSSQETTKWNVIATLPTSTNTVTSGQVVAGYEKFILGTKEAQNTLWLETGIWSCPATGNWFIGFCPVISSQASNTNSNGVCGGWVTGSSVYSTGIWSLTEGTDLGGTVITPNLGSQVPIITGSTPQSCFIAIFINSGAS